MSLLTPSTVPPMEPALLRREIRGQRRRLSTQTLERHSRMLLRLACNYKPFRHSSRIAFYIASRGEIDPSPLLALAMQTGKQAYLPVLKRPGHGLWFAPFSSGDRLTDNRFGIPEPSLQLNRIVMPWALDLVFVPLVAFDDNGNRLGMGGGFYDRTFAFKQQRRYWKGPKLIGLAHDFQHVNHLSRQAWDIPLDAVITQRHIYQFDPVHNSSCA